MINENQTKEFINAAGRRHEESLSIFAPTEVREPGPVVEVMPGVTVSQAQIDAAVEATTSPSVVDLAEEKFDNVKRRTESLHAEVKEDLEISKRVVQEMVERMRTPLNMQEKYVSLDAMPEPLKRVVKAYAELDSAKTELAAAIAGLNAAAAETSKV